MLQGEISLWLGLFISSAQSFTSPLELISALSPVWCETLKHTASLFGTILLKTINLPRQARDKCNL